MVILLNMKKKIYMLGSTLLDIISVYTNVKYYKIKYNRITVALKTLLVYVSLHDTSIKFNYKRKLI